MSRHINAVRRASDLAMSVSPIAWFAVGIALAFSDDAMFRVAGVIYAGVAGVMAMKMTMQKEIENVNRLNDELFNRLMRAYILLRSMGVGK